MISHSLKSIVRVIRLKRASWNFYHLLILIILVTIFCLLYGNNAGTFGKETSLHEFSINVLDNYEVEEFNEQDYGGHANLDYETGSKNLSAENRLAARRERVQKLCRMKSSSEHLSKCDLSGHLKYHFNFFHEHNATVCTISKAGSSTWRLHLRRVNKGPPLRVPIYQDKIKRHFINQSRELVFRGIYSSSKIITVRHPLSRLVSAYREKYRGGRYMLRNFSGIEKRRRKKIAGSYWDDRFYQFWLPALAVNRKVPPHIHVKIGLKDPIDPSVRYPEWVYMKLYTLLRPKLSFTEFIRYVIHTYEKGTPDDHWAPYYKTCFPCCLDYQYITRIETLSDDLSYVFKKIGIPADPGISKNQIQFRPDVLDRDFQYYRTLPSTLRRELYTYIKDDLDLFGYNLPKSYLY